MAAFLKEIEGGQPALKHVDTTDKSGPVIDNDIKIGANPMEEVKKSIAAGASLKHVDTTADRSAPMIEKDVKIHENARPALFNELKSKAVASN